MKHRRVRTDEFTTQSNVLRVTGRQGYEESTDVWITREAQVEFEQKAEDTIDPGWNVIEARDDGEPGHYTIPYNLQHLNLTGKVDLQLAPHSICNGLENVKIKPVGCTSFYDAYPKTQSKLLPYLVPSGTRERVGFQDTKIAVFDETSESAVLYAAPIRWDPRVNGNFVLTTHPTAHLPLVDTVVNQVTVPRPNPDSLLATGFCPVGLVAFGTAPPDGNDGGNFVPFEAAHPYLIRVEYEPEVDELSFNKPGDVIVRINAHVLDPGNVAANANQFHYFRLNADDQANVDRIYLQNDLWKMKFDENGVGGRITRHGLSGPEAEQAEEWFGLKNGRPENAPFNNAKYEYDAERFNEFWEIFLWSATRPEKLLPHNNTAIPAAHNDSIIRLFLRRPKFSKGQLRNWATDPGINRLFSWFGKEIDPQGPLEHRKEGDNLRPTSFSTFGQTNSLIRAIGDDDNVGTFAVTWTDTGVINAGLYPDRMINSLVLSLSSQALYERISMAPNAETFTLKLVTGPLVQKPFARPPVFVGEQFGDITRQFYLRFTKQQATYNDGQVTITFTRVGGFNPLWHAGNVAFANGKPMIGSCSDLRAVRSNAGGVGAWLEPSAPGQPLVGVPTNLGAIPFASDVTQVPNVWADNTRPLFHTDLLNTAGDNFSLHTKANPADAGDGAGVVGDPLFEALVEMFTGTIYVDKPALANYRNVASGRSKPSNITFREPFFGLDSGMSTYKVDTIFKPKKWHNILLQDFDYFFESASQTNAVVKQGPTLKYKVVANQEEVVKTQEFTGSLTLTHLPETKLTVRSRDGLDQRVKLLEHMNEAYPLFKKYTTQIAGAESPKGRVSIYSERGVPDYLFIFADRNLSSDATFIPSGNPIVTGLTVYGRTNKNKALSSYLSNKHEIWQATLRNSHYQSSAEELYQVGGCLISRADLGTLERHNYRLTDPFDYDLLVTLENEEGGTDEQKEDRDADSITLHVCCIYEDSVILKGTAQNLSFSEEKRVLQ